VGIPVDNLSVNPARSIGPALFVGGWALGQLWLFIVAPLIGGACAAGMYRVLQQPPVLLTAQEAEKALPSQQIERVAPSV
jgi:aquaporin Z